MDKTALIWAIVLTSLLVVLSAWFARIPDFGSNSLNGQIEPKMAIIQGNSVLPISTYGFRGEVRATLIGIEDKPGDYEEREIKHFQPLLNKIIDCESKWNVDACNTCKGTEWEGMYPPESCACGKGFGQLTNDIIEKCSKELGREIDPFNKEDNLECSLHIFLTEGPQHWGCEDCKWGSYKCWKDYQ